MSTNLCKSNDFESLCQNWLICNQAKYKRSTFSVYSTNIQRYILPYFKNKTLKDINNLTIKEFGTFLLSKGRRCSLGGLSSSTVNNILIVLKKIIAFGRSECGLPIENLSINYLRYNRKKITILNKECIRKLNSFLLMEKSSFNFGMLLSIYTGIRIGELCGLQWKDIHPDGVLDINKTLLRIKNPSYLPGSNISKTKVIIDKPKTFSSIRQIPIPSLLLKEATRYYGSRDNYILTNSSNYMEPRVVQYRFKRCLQICDITTTNFHILRHTFASYCIESGTDYKSLSEILGHSSVKTTLGIYVHSNMYLKKKYIESMSEMLN